MRRRPPRSTLTYTLLPYTTRFRSGDRCRRLIATREIGDRFSRRGLLLEQRDVLSGGDVFARMDHRARSEEHTSELQSLMRTSYAVFCLKKKTTIDAHEATALLARNRTPNTSNTNPSLQVRHT